VASMRTAPYIQADVAQPTWQDVCRRSHGRHTMKVWRRSDERHTSTYVWPPEPAQARPLLISCSALLPPPPTSHPTSLPQPNHSQI
jgi:hypothetical protein